MGQFKDPNVVHIIYGVVTVGEPVREHVLFMCTKSFNLYTKF